MTKSTADQAQTRAHGPYIGPEKLLAFTSAVYQSAGVPAEDADLVADTLVQADLWGHQSHGLLRLEWYHARLMSGASSSDSGAIALCLPCRPRSQP